jgi:hypothetical protein
MRPYVLVAEFIVPTTNPDTVAPVFENKPYVPDDPLNHIAFTLLIVPNVLFGVPKIVVLFPFPDLSVHADTAVVPVIVEESEPSNQS